MNGAFFRSLLSVKCFAETVRNVPLDKVRDLRRKRNCFVKAEDLKKKVFGLKYAAGY